MLGFAFLLLLGVNWHVSTKSQLSNFAKLGLVTVLNFQTYNGGRNGQYWCGHTLFMRAITVVGYKFELVVQQI